MRPPHDPSANIIRERKMEMRSCVGDLIEKEREASAKIASRLFLVKQTCPREKAWAWHPAIPRQSIVTQRGGALPREPVGFAQSAARRCVT